MIDVLKQSITLLIIFPTIIIFGGYLTYRLRFLQIVKLGRAFSLVTLREKKGSISSFGALAAILGGNLGTGNISGVAVALMTGGPGALFWMWVMAILASITKYAGCFLGVHFQRLDERGEWVGGPMYYLSEGLKSKFLAALFCVFTITSALTVGNLVQVNALSAPLAEFDVAPWMFGIVMAILVGGVILGGLKRFAHVVSALVPLMAVAYILTCIGVLVIFRHEILPNLGLIMAGAFDLKPMSGGIFGFGILTTIRIGFDRGLFATDSGLGLAPILHASVRDDNPQIDNRVIQGLISVLSPMIVMVVCSMTGLVLLTTGASKLANTSSTTMCMEAFRIGFGGAWAGHLVSVTLFFFAFTTILTWSFCADKAVEFLGGARLIRPFQLVFIAIIPLGTLVGDLWVWNVADFSTNLMFIVNMIGVIGLSKMVLTASRKYFK
jgi:AGCS family alanine or glycine:cation symporter